MNATSLTDAAFETVPLSPTIGVEVRGLDLRRPMSAGTAARLDRMFYDNMVLLFRGQDLSEDQFLAFGANFGPLGKRARPAERRPEGTNYNTDAVMLVSNVRQNPDAKGYLHDGEFWWHTDTSHRAVPHKATILHALEIPSRGGNTRFASMYAAYDSLPAALKRRIDGLHAMQVYDYALTEKVDISNGYEQYAHARHPVAITHPFTGRRALYVNRLTTAFIEGMTQAESDALLETLVDHAESESNHYYEHVWRVGDVVMWDNLASIHARTDFPKDERRILRRITVEGEAAPKA